MNRLVKSKIAIIVALGLGMPLSAYGADLGDKESHRVSFDDLDIENAAGARVLYARLRQASRKACDVAPRTQRRPVEEVLEAKNCYDRVLDEAVARIDSEALTDIHSG